MIIAAKHLLLTEITQAKCIYTQPESPSAIQVLFWPENRVTKIEIWMLADKQESECYVA